MPDVACRVGCNVGYIELKVSLVKKAATPLKPGLRPDQRNWLEEFRGPAVFDNENRRRAPGGVLIAVPYINQSVVYVPANKDNTEWWDEAYSFSHWFQRSLTILPDPPVIWSYQNAFGWKSFFHTWSTR